MTVVLVLLVIGYLIYKDSTKRKPAVIQKERVQENTTELRTSWR